MTISPGAGTTANSASSTATTQAITVPSGVQGQDLVLVNAQVVTLTSTAPTLSASSTGTTPSLSKSVSGTESLPAAVTGSVFSFVAAGTAGSASSDVGKVITVSAGGTAVGYWAVAVESWRDSSGSPPTVDVINGAFGGAGSITVTCPTLSTGAAGDWAVYFGGGADEGGSLVPPSGSTIRQGVNSSANVSAGIYDSNGSVGAAGTSIGGGTFSTSASGNSILTAFTIGIAPPTAGLAAGLATGAGTALAPATGRAAGLATGAGTAEGISQAANAGLATGAGAALASAVGIVAGLAAGAGAAGGISQAANAGTATGAGAAGGLGTGVASALATGAGAALAPASGIASALATGAGAALPSAIRFATGLATGAGAATTPAAARVTGLATGAGAALAPASALVTGLATGAGAAFPATVGAGVRNPENLGANFTYANYGGSAVTVAGTYGAVITLAVYGGGATPATIDAVCALVTIDGAVTTPATTYGGTVNSVTTDAGLVGWTMQNANLTLAENNDETINVAITQNGSALSLSGATVNMYLKTAAGTPDGSALLLSSAGGSPAITITNSSGGLCSVAIPHADLTAETNTFYRIDVVISGLQNTCVYGNITWITL